MGISIRYDKNAVERRVKSEKKKTKKNQKKNKKNKEQREKKGSFPNRSLLRQQTDLPV